MNIKNELPEEHLIDVKEEIYSEPAATHFDIQGKISVKLKSLS